MSEHQGPLDERLAALFAQHAADGAGDHPSAERLTRYQGHGLPAAEADRVRAHLALCPRCVERLLDRADAAAAGVATAAIAARAGGARRAGRWRWPLALAAASAVACLLLLARVVTLERQPATRAAAALDSEPLAGVPIVDLYPPGALRGGEAPAAVTLPADAALVLLVLTPRAPRPGTAYTVRIVAVDDSAGDPRWQHTVAANEAGGVAVALPRGFLAAGEHVVELVPASGGGADRYRIAVAPP